MSCICVMACCGGRCGRVGVAEAAEAEVVRPPPSAPSILDDAPQPLVPDSRGPRPNATTSKPLPCSLPADARAAGRICRRPAVLPAGLALRSAVGHGRAHCARGPPAETQRRGRPLCAEGGRLEDTDPLLLRRLGLIWPRRAIGPRPCALRKGPGRRGADKETAADLLLRMEMGRLYYLTEKYKPAADCFARVIYALDHPDEFALDEQLGRRC